MNRDFKGVWIPKEIWLSKELKIMEKLFLVEIDSLDASPRGCYASNGKLSEFFQISKGRCTQIIKSLESKNLIKITLIREGKQIKERRIKVVSKLNRVVSKLNTPSENIKRPYLENDEGSNTKQSNTRERDALAKTFISDDFQPSEEILFDLKRNGLKPLDKNELQIFIDHYQGEGIAKANWDKVYRKWVVVQRTVYDKQGSKHSKRPDNTVRPLATKKHVATEIDEKLNRERLEQFAKAATANKN